MKRGRREKIERNNNAKYLLYLSGGVLLIMIITFIIIFTIYKNKLKEYTYSGLTTEKIADLVPNNVENLDQRNEEIEQASADIGKSIKEVIDNINETKKEPENKVEKLNTDANIEVEKKAVSGKIKKDSASEEIKKEPPIIKEKDPEFTRPVEGEIIRNFAKDSLIYSETLQEWVTHLGIDIKANRTTVVKAAERGTVTAIKNDPRYGLTIVIEHTNGFKTIYSNLLSTEFVSEQEKVEKGQAIGTVGNSAAFEITDEPHLHFEIIKDDINVDPNMYIK